MQIQVNYEEVMQTSRTFSQKGEQYQEIIQRINARMHEMQTIWQGADNQAFISQLEGFQPKLQEVKTVIEQYASFLAASANQYQQLQQQIAQNARSLA